MLTTAATASLGSAGTLAGSGSSCMVGGLPPERIANMPPFVDFAGEMNDVPTHQSKCDIHRSAPVAADDGAPPPPSSSDRERAIGIRDNVRYVGRVPGENDLRRLTPAASIADLYELASALHDIDQRDGATAGRDSSHRRRRPGGVPPLHSRRPASTAGRVRSTLPPSESKPQTRVGRQSAAASLSRSNQRSSRAAPRAATSSST